MRPLDKVIEAIQRITPEDFDKREEWLRVLDRIKDSVYYAAPEVMPAWWSALAHACEDILGDPNTCEWKSRIAMVVMDKIDYKGILNEPS